MTSFGLQVPSFTFGGPDAEIFDRVAELARTADESGFHSLWVMDHLYQLDPLGGPDQPMLEAYTLLGALAAVTERVRLGTLVTGVTYRNPALLAKIVTTLDVISQGRAVLGIGAAWHEAEHAGFGFEYPPIGRRLDRLEEALQICRAMFREDGASFEGKHYRISGVRNVPRPLQDGGPPILIGGGGEKRTLRLVAQYGDACNITGDIETIRHKLDVLRRHCEDVGRDYDEISKTRMATLMLVDSAEEARARREAILQAAPDALRMVMIGDPETILAELSELDEVGIDEHIFNMPGASPDDVRRAAELLAARYEGLEARS